MTGSMILLLIYFNLQYGLCVILNTTTVTEGSNGCLVFQFNPETNLSTSLKIFNKGVPIINMLNPTFIIVRDEYKNRTNYTANLSQKMISLCLQNITVDDTGDYDLQNGTLNYTNVLQVLVELTYVRLDPTPGVEMNESETKVFKCVARSIPLANITWSIVGSVWSNSTRDTLSSYLSYIGNRSDHNKYLYCTARMENQTVFSSKVKISIIYAPEKKPNVEVIPEEGIIAGNNVTLKCSTWGGNPLPVLSWNCSSSQEQSNTTGDQLSISITFTVNKADNNKICACSTTHPVEAYRTNVYHRLVVFYAPDANLSIVQNPTDAVAQQSVKLTCKVYGGNPLAILSWNCSGSATNNTAENTASYSVEFTASKSDNNKVCTCSANHTVTSYKPMLQYKLTVFFPPGEPLQIENGQKSILLYENRTAQLTCKMVGGNPLANLYFTCDSYLGQYQSNSTTSISVLQLNPTRTMNGRGCICNATHKLLNATQEVNLQVYFPPDSPSLYFSPNLPLLEGEPANVDCNATLGNPLQSFYEWYLNGQLQPEQNTNIFLFRNVTKVNNLSLLHCKIRNNFTDHENISRQSNAEILNVNYYPSFTMSERKVRVNETVTINQTCNADGNPQPDVQWFLKNVPVSQRNKSQTTLYIQSSDRSNAGIYECKANASSHNKPLQRSFHLEIIVNYAPDVHIEVNSSNLELDGTATLTCVPNGIPESYTYTGWQHKYQGLVIRTNEQLSQFQMDKGQALVLRNITYQDMGEYRCSVKNNIVDKNGLLDQANTTYVLVSGPPIISGNDKDSTFTAEIGHPLTAKFNFFTFPNVSKIQWYNKTSEINQSTSLSINLSETSLPLILYGTKVNVSNFSYQASLILNHFQMEDEGPYMLMIKNQLKETNVSFRAVISGPPEPPFDIKVAKKSDTTVLLSWRPGFDGGNEQTFNVIYHVLGYENIIVHNSVADDKNKTQYITITELQPSTTYIVIVFSSNRKGNSSIIPPPFNVTTDSQKVEQSAESSSTTVGMAAGIATTAVAIVIVVILLFLIRRRIICKAKDAKAGTNGRSKLTRFDDNEGEGLHDNILYQSVDSNHFRGDSGTEYAVVQKNGNKSKVNLKEDYQETALNTAVKKNHKIAEQKGKCQEVYVNVVKQSKFDGAMSEKTRNQDSLVYADLLFNPLPTGSKFIIHGLDDRTVYAEVDTTQRIDTLPDSDEEDKLKNHSG